MNGQPSKSFSDLTLGERYLYGMIPFSLIIGTLIAVFLSVSFGIAVAVVQIISFGLFVWSTYGGWHFWIATLLLWIFLMFATWWTFWFHALRGLPSVAVQLTILMIACYCASWLVRLYQRKRRGAD